MLVRLHTAVSPDLAGIFVLPNGAMIAVCDGTGVELNHLTADELRGLAQLLSNAADELASAQHQDGAFRLATVLPVGSA